MLKFLSPQSQSRFRELQSKLGTFSISSEEQQELADLVAKGQKIFQQRDAVIARIKHDLAESGIGIHDLFGAAEIRAAARPGSANSAAAAPLPGRRAGPRAGAKGGATVLIRAKIGKGAGAPSKYHRGQKLPPLVPRNFKALDEGGALSQNLSKYYTDEGRAYFSTPEGQAELARLEEYIRTGKRPRA